MSLTSSKADALVQAWQARYGGALPTWTALLNVLSVADLETGMGEYRGTGRTKLSVPSHNWGQIQRRVLTKDESAELAAGGIPPARDASEFLSSDTSPDTGAYNVWLWRFHDDVQGAGKLLQVLLDNRPSIKAQIDTLTPIELAALMYDSRYYEGSHSRTEPGGREANIAAYGGSLRKHADKLTAALMGYVIRPGGGTPPAPPVVPPPPPPPAAPPTSSSIAKGVALFAFGIAVTYWAAR